MKCRVCGRKPEDTPIVFKNEPYCSDDHRKVITGEKAPKDNEWATMDRALFERLGGVCRE